MTHSLLSAILTAAIEVILIGTGFPRPDPAHAGAATVVVAGDKWFLVDAGRGATMRIAATELRYDQLRAVFLTHLHSDHTAGLPDLFDTSWQFGRKTTPLQLYGPAGTKRLADAMLEFFHDDIRIRRSMQDLPGGGATIETHIVREGIVYDDGVCRVTAFAVDLFGHGESDRPFDADFGIALGHRARRARCRPHPYTPLCKGLAQNTADKTCGACDQNALGHASPSTPAPPEFVRSADPSSGVAHSHRLRISGDVRRKTAFSTPPAPLH